VETLEEERVAETPAAAQGRFTLGTGYNVLFGPQSISLAELNNLDDARLQAVGDLTVPAAAAAHWCRRATLPVVICRCSLFHLCSTWVDFPAALWRGALQRPDRSARRHGL
jgi:hypothetical protein